MRIIIAPAKKMIVDTDSFAVDGLPRSLEQTERLKAALLAPDKPEPPEDRNILHLGDGERTAEAASRIARSEGQRQAAPTRTRPREDPSTREIVRTANADAYAADIRSFRNGGC